MTLRSSAAAQRRPGLRSRLASARRRAAVVTSAALLATGLSVSGCSVSEPSAPPMIAEAVPPPMTQVLPPILLVSDSTAGVAADESTAAPDSEESPTPAPSEETAPEESEAEAKGEPIGSGRASYYGAELAGNRTASGERFDPRDLTAAHRTLPFGTRLRVTNERTGASVVVRVNDRGPFHGERVLDVSTAAAEEIGMKRAGSAHVTMERLPRRSARG